VLFVTFVVTKSKIMFGKIRDSFGKSIIYGFGNLFSKFIGFLLLPIIVKETTLADYGAIGLLESTAIIITALLGFGINSALERWYWDKQYIDKQKSMFFTVMMFTLFISAFILFFGFTFLKSITLLVLDKEQYQYAFALTLFGVVFDLISHNSGSLVRLKEKSILFTKANIVRFTVTLIFTLVLLLGFNRGIDGVFEAKLIASIAYFAVFIPITFKNITPVFEKTILWEMIMFRLPLLISTASLQILNFADRYMIKFITNIEDSGLYSYAFKIGNTLKIVIVTSIWMSVVPIIYKMMETPDGKRYQQKMMTYIAFVVVMFGISMSLFSKEIITLMSLKNPEYWESWVIIPITTFAIYFGVFKDLTIMGLNIAKKTGVIALSSVLASVLNVILNFIFIKYIGYVGAAWATVISQVFMLFMVYVSANKHYPVNYEIRKIAVLLLLAGGVVFFGNMINGVDILLRAPLKILMVIAFPFVLYPLGFYDKTEIDWIVKLWKKWKNPKNFMSNIKELIKGVGHQQ